MQDLRSLFTEFYSCCCDFEEMASLAGNKRSHSKHSLDVEYAALMEIDRGLPNKDVSKKFNVPKTPCPRGKRTGKK